MKGLLSKLNLAASSILNAADLVNFRGGCDLQTCVNCCNTASGGWGSGGGACGSSCGCTNCSCYGDCVRNICGQCFSNFSDYSYGCYC